MPKRDAGQITGTNADLRRLSMQKSQEVLLSLGVKEDEIKGAWTACPHAFHDVPSHPPQDSQAQAQRNLGTMVIKGMVARVA